MMAKTKTVQKEEKKEYTDKEREELEREYKKHLGEFMEIHRKTPSVFVPILCADLHQAYPELTNKQIQHRILEDCCGPEDWSRFTIQRQWPDWIKNPNMIEAGKISRKASKNVAFAEQIAKPYEKVPEPVVEEPQEQTTDDGGYIAGDADLEPMEGTGKTILSSFGDIREAAQDLYVSLTGEKVMPVTEDFQVEHLRPTKDYRSAIAHELDDRQRVGLNNWLSYAIEVAMDMIQIIDEIDKKEAAKKQ